MVAAKRTHAPFSFAEFLVQWTAGGIFVFAAPLPPDVRGPSICDELAAQIAVWTYMVRANRMQARTLLAH